jgi:peroxiredoxin
VLDLGDTPLLSDWNGDAVRGFDIGIDYRGMKGVAERSAFLVGGDGIIRAAWRYETGEVPDFDELLTAARSLS